MLRKSITVLLSLALCLVLAAPSFAAQKKGKHYPSKPVHIIVHGKAGAGMDMFARALGKAMEEKMPVPAVVENRPGGGSAVATTYVATSRDPGYVLLAVTNTHLITPLTNKTPHSVRDLRPVAMMVNDPTVIVTRGDAPWNNLDDLLKDVKARPDTISCAVAFVGSLDYFVIHRLKQLGYNLKPLPFEGGNDAVVSIVGGHSDVGIVEPAEVESQVRAGNLKILATFSPRRLPTFPDLPTAVEQGYDVTVSKFRGIMAPKNTPDEVVAYLENLLKQVADDSTTFKSFADQGGTLINYMDSRDFGNWLNGTVEQTRQYLLEVNLIK